MKWLKRTTSEDLNTMKGSKLKKDRVKNAICVLCNNSFPHIFTELKRTTVAKLLSN